MYDKVHYKKKKKKTIVSEKKKKKENHCTQLEDINSQKLTLNFRTFVTLRSTFPYTDV